MKRDLYNVLLNWKEKFIETPLMVIGARQVGKTYIIDKFVSENFDDYIYKLQKIRLYFLMKFKNQKM